MHKTKVMLIYTGGTIGMYKNPETGALAPLNFNHISKQVPELSKLNFELQTYSFCPVIDSSNVDPSFWVELATVIYNNYHSFDGFVILHGTDTMSYTASALSFMLSNLAKPVILTGSQLPIGTLRSDGKLNLITSLEISAGRHHDEPIVPEVCIYFENQLYRGNRTSKQNAEFFDAFRSGNYPPLAEVGINIKYNYWAIHYPSENTTIALNTHFDTNVAVVKVYPGLNPRYIDSLTDTQGLRAIVLESYGAGNAPTTTEFISAIKRAIENEIIILNITQCFAGSVMMGHYDTSVELLQIGVISGRDLTTEAAVTKLMYLLGGSQDTNHIKQQLGTPLAGEMSTV